MNTNGLARQYAKLTPRERLPLIMAASGRGDKAEAERLAQSAPRVHWSVGDYFGLGMALHEVSGIHLMELLDLAANYLRCFGLGDDRDNKNADRFLDVARMFGFVFNTRLAGWRQFCREQNLDPMLCWSVLPGFALLQHAEKVAESAAFEPEGAARFLKDADSADSDGELITADSVAKELRDCLEARAAWWG